MQVVSISVFLSYHAMFRIGNITSNVSSSREEPSFASEYSEDGIRVFIQISESIYCFLQELSPKRVESIRSVEL
jgi:hypothetical protein